MTNTTKVKLSLSVVAAAFAQARKDDLRSAWVNSVPLDEFLEAGLFELQMTMRGGQGRYVTRVRVSEAGRVWFAAQKITLPPAIYEV